MRSIRLPFGVLLVALLFFTNCEETEWPLTAPNEQLLFPQSLELDIQQSTRDGDSPIQFELTEVGVGYLFVGIFSAPPVVVDGATLQNPDQLIWKWEGVPFAGQIIPLTDGEATSEEITLDTEYFQCQFGELYWAAWGWDETGQYITYSTRGDLQVVYEAPIPVLENLQIRKLGSFPGDTLLIPGEVIDFQFEVANTGTATATAVEMQVQILTGPSTSFNLLIDDIAPDFSANPQVGISIPPELTLGDSLLINIILTYNNCITTQQQTALIINAATVCLEQVHLIEIRTPPPGGIWDFPAFPPDGRQPDPYFLIFNPSIGEIYRSMVIDDVVDARPQVPYMADWPLITPCLPLELTTTYSIEFWDNDSNFNDEIIGDIGLRAADYLPEQPDTVVISNNQLVVELILEWD